MINIFKKTFLGLMITMAMGMAVLVPNVALADSCTDLQTKFPTNSNLSANINSVPKYCSIELVYAKFINLALYAIGIVAVIVIIYGGYIYMTSRGNEEQAKRGRAILTWSIIGLIVVLGAAALVNAVVKFIVE